MVWATSTINDIQQIVFLSIVYVPFGCRALFTVKIKAYTYPRKDRGWGMLSGDKRKSQAYETKVGIYKANKIGPATTPTHEALLDPAT